MSVPAIIGWDQAYNRNGSGDVPRAVVNVIRTYMNNHTLEGWVKGETLAEATGLKIRQVRRQIADNVEAGWLEILKSGNSSGLANRYRLAYPKGVVEDTLRNGSGNGVMEDTQRVSSKAEKGVLDDTPTTPLTTPGTSPKRSSTTPEKGVMDDTLASDPWGSVGVGHLPPRSTSESKGVVDDTLPIGATDDPLGLIAEFKLSNRYLETGHSVILWPSDKPLPDGYHPGDPFKSSTYIDDKTGVALTG